MSDDPTPERLSAWREEHRKLPSGKRCDGIHDATPDRRTLALVDALTEARRERDAAHERWSDEMDARYAAEAKLASVRALAEEHWDWKAGRVLADRLRDVLDRQYGEGES